MIDFMTPDNILQGIKGAHKIKQTVDSLGRKPADELTADQQALLNGYEATKAMVEQNYSGQRYFIWVTYENGKPKFHALLMPQHE